MRIPMEHFSTTPVITMSPNAPPTAVTTEDDLDDGDAKSGPKSLRERVSGMLLGPPTSYNEVKRRATISVGSAPTSPAIRRKNATSLLFEGTRDNEDTNAGSMRPNLTSQQMMSASLTSFDRGEVDDEYDNHFTHDNNQGPVSLPFGEDRNNSGSYFQR
jgi:hypothetical protein